MIPGIGAATPRDNDFAQNCCRPTRSSRDSEPSGFSSQITCSLIAFIKAHQGGCRVCYEGEYLCPRTVPLHFLWSCHQSTFCQQASLLLPYELLSSVMMHWFLGSRRLPYCAVADFEICSSSDCSFYRLGWKPTPCLIYSKMRILLAEWEGDVIAGCYGSSCKKGRHL